MNKDRYRITTEGSLGLLAIGDVGFKKWKDLRIKQKSKSLFIKNDKK